MTADATFDLRQPERLTGLIAGAVAMVLTMRRNGRLSTGQNKP